MLCSSLPLTSEFFEDETGGMSSGVYNRSWKIVLGRQEGWVINFSSGSGGFIRLGKLSKKVVRGGGERTSVGDLLIV